MSPQGWTRIAKAVNADSRVANRVIYDVLNEPDAFGLAFEPKNGKPGMRDLYLKSFDAIYAVNPGAPAHAVSQTLRFVLWVVTSCALWAAARWEFGLKHVYPEELVRWAKTTIGHLHCSFHHDDRGPGTAELWQP
jgi:hypothetical protein